MWMCDVYGEICFHSKNVYKTAKYGFSTESLRQKDNLWSGNALTLW